MADRLIVRDRTPVQAVAMLVGATFLLVGILGFIPGITTHYDDLSFAGEDSTSKLLGVFQTSILHNIVHLLFGIAGLSLARTWSGARSFLIGGGVIYLALWLLGILGGGDWIPTNTPDDWLHLVLGVGMVGLGFVTTRGGEMTARPAV
jgi:Domain of unknown function (DUF4383)